MPITARTFRSASLKASCDEYGIDIQWRPVRTPHFGGHIERLMGTVAKEIHALPGTTFSNPKQRGEYNAEAKAVMTLPEMRRWLVQYIVGVYHQRKHRGIGMAPIDRWQEGILGNDRQKGVGLPEPVTDSLRLRLDFLPFEERTVQRYGIVWDKVTYYGDVLRPWINLSQGRQKQKFLVRRDPTDISLIYVLDPEQNVYFYAPYRDQTKPSLSIWEFRAAETFLRDHGVRDAGENEIFRAREEMLRIEEGARKETKRQRRDRERKKHHAEIALRAFQTDQQLGNRFDPFQLPRWAIDGGYALFLARLCESMELQKPSNLHSKQLVTRFHTMTEGLTGETTKLMSAAAELAIKTGREMIDTALLDEVRWTAPGERRRGGWLA